MNHGRHLRCRHHALSAPHQRATLFIHVQTPLERSNLRHAADLETEAGDPNVLLVVANDEGVTHFPEERDGIPLVSRPQIYLDVLGLPGAESIAGRLLERMAWRD